MKPDLICQEKTRESPKNFTLEILNLKLEGLSLLSSYEAAL